MRGELGVWSCPLGADADEARVTQTVAGGDGRRHQALWQEPGDAPDRYDAHAAALGASAASPSRRLRLRAGQGAALLGQARPGWDYVD